MTRRETLAGILGATVTGSTALAGTGAKTSRMPSIFLAHGAPPLLDLPQWVGELKSWAAALPKPKAVLMLSAHWEKQPITFGATKTVPLVYDFYGFPQRYYEVKYAAPGAPQLADRLEKVLKGKWPTQRSDRGLDHGAYVPLVAMYPDADVPVLQVSLPSEQPQELYELGLALDPLRDEGVLIIGSGFITHNLRAGFLDETPSWAKEFDGWVADALTRNDVDALMDYRAKAPGVQQSLPTQEHFVPLLTAMGAGGAQNVRAQFPITGFWGGSFTRRSVQFG
jgi:4,5-DOPA dioxygenase extradiol